ncbi:MULTISPECIES: IclR family transcriptional regulator domain-containing protein [Subtercola]|uniref:Glycerol operon regulatory protein n=1 Tax=Subtercola vilae TaxID=2056433 RepID=A0A4T2C5N5_9MICO|nr:MULTISPECIES: IclR family transcriptional regulator C-terminal domain-containing protein [Subtercola]MEA9984454.1 IclR family transcriptional regulator C-terminal domain-containing protein [Subtercola sp. RTI3]TIH37776.1 IclR family transcriptional regulator [Subtercola vilae]
MSDTGEFDLPGPSAGFVQSLARGLSVIRVFGHDTPLMTLSEIARATGLTRATSRRFLLTLIELGYVRTDGKTFALTAKVLELGFSYLSGITLPEIAQPHLEALSRSVGESTSAAIIDGPDIVYIVRVPTHRIMTVGINLGTRLPAYATSMGRVLLAGLSPADLASYLHDVKLRALTERTVGSENALTAELDKVRSNGWAVVDQELEPGLRSIAVPLSGPDGRVVGAINVSTQASSGTNDAMRKKYLAALKQTAARIESDLQLAPTAL